MEIPKHIVDKYNRPVPRYTSYPPANFFHEDYNEKDFLESIVRSNKQEPRNISLYIHIPFCNKICHYCGCNSMKIREPEMLNAYIQAIRKELMIFRKYLSEERKVSQVHWGGGTPNALPSGMVREVMGQVLRDFRFIEKPEIAIECNPAGLSNAYIEDLKDSGFNRISLGIQDFSTQVLKAVNRDNAERPVEEITDFIRSRNIKFNLDFIYGLPYQNVDSFKETMERAIRIHPDRLVTFSYAHVPWVRPAQKKLEDIGLPGPDEKTAMFEAAAGLLHEAGYRSIGFDHYAREDDELWLALKNRKLHRNFQGYCTRETTGQVYAAGISSISQLYDSYSQNTKSINAYIASLLKGRIPVEKGYLLTQPEIITRDVINELMCNFYMDPNEVAWNNRIPVSELKKNIRWDTKLLKELEEDQLIRLHEDRVEILERGRFFIRNVAAAFDPLQEVESGRKFSKSV